VTDPSQRPSREGREAGTRDRRWALFVGLVPLAVLFDQVTKYLADEHLAGRMGGVREVVEGFFMLRYSTNRGAFFSIGEGLPDGVRVAFFATAALAALGAIVWVYRDAPAERGGLRAGLLLLAAGAIGNLIDRVQYGEVIDFLHLHYRDVFHWATFNVADIYITIGLVFLIWDAFRTPALREPAEVSGTT